MKWAADVYGADQTYYLINGSTGRDTGSCMRIRSQEAENPGEAGTAINPCTMESV